MIPTSISSTVVESESSAGAKREAARSQAGHVRQNAPLAALCVAAICLGFVLVFGGLAAHRLQAMRSDLGDVALFDHMFWTTLHGHLLEFTRELDAPANYLSFHFSPFLLVLAPLILIFKGPEYLPAVQVLAWAAGAIPLALWAARRFNTVAAGPAFALAFVLSPVGLQTIAVPFHEIALAVPFLGFALYFQLTRRWRLTFVFAVLALTVKEEVAFSILGMGLYAVLAQRERRAGTALLTLALGWAVVALGIVMPRLGAGQVYFVADYGYLGASSPMGIAAGLLTHPTLALQHMFTPEKLRFVLLLLLPMGLVLPLIGWRLALLAAPALAYILIGDSPVRYDLYFAYYATPAIPFLYFAAVEGAAVLARRIKVTGSLLVSLGAAIAAYFTMTAGPGTSQFSPAVYEVTSRESTVARLLEALPSDQSVSATPNLSPYVARHDYHFFPEIVVPTDIYAIDLKNWPRWGPYPSNYVAYDSALRRIMQNPEYSASYEAPGLVIATRGPDPIPSHSVGASLGQAVTLIGYDRPLTIKAGAPAVFRLYWRSEKTLDKTYTVFVHFGNDSNDKLAQQDGWPWDGYFPTTEWAPGKEIVDPHTLDIPKELAPGPYLLRVGMYYNGPAGLEPLPLPSGEQALTLGPFEVLAP